MKVLVVDDESLIRLAVAEVFRDCGAQVVEAANAQRALDVLLVDPDITLLFTDIRMPGMSGLKLAALVKKLRPHLKIAFTTGFIEAAVPEEYLVIRKPWNAADLVALVQETHSGSPSTSA